MNFFFRATPLLTTLALCLSAGAALAHDYKAGAIVVGHPYARATVPGQRAGGGYLTLFNHGTVADRLLAVKADVSATVELHQMSMDGDVMRMREIDAIDVPVGKRVELKPGGYHLMFMGLKAPLKAGANFPATLTFEKAGDVKVVINVDDANAAGKASHAH